MKARGQHMVASASVARVPIFSLICLLCPLLPLRFMVMHLTMDHVCPRPHSAIRYMGAYVSCSLPLL